MGTNISGIAFRRYYDALLDTDRTVAIGAVKAVLEGGGAAEEVVFEMVVPSLELMMKAVQEGGEISLAQHFMAAQIGSEVVDFAIPLFSKAPEMVGKVVIGTSEGDFHGLGKKIVSGCLKAMMVEVIDLGLSVPPERFVEEAVSSGAQVIAISSMMIHTARGERGCRGVRRLLADRELGGAFRVAVGGAPYRFDHGLYATVGADGWAENGIEAGKVISAMIREVSKR